MKMEKIFRNLLLLFAVISLGACSEKVEETVPVVGNNSLQVTPGRLSFTSTGGTEQLQVRTSYQYYGYDISVDWLEGGFVDDPTYNYIAITAEPNTSSYARTAIIKITGSNSKGSIEESISVTVEQEGRDKMPVTQDYKDYLSAGGLREDVVAMAELTGRTELLQLLYMKMSSNGWKDDLFSTYEFDEADVKRYYEVWQSLIDDADKYETAINRLSQFQALGTESPKTRAWNIPFFSTLKLSNLWRKSAAAGRVSIMAVAHASGNLQNEAWLKERFDLLPTEFRYGTQDFREFWNTLSAGKLDDQSNRIFGVMYGGLTGGTNDPEFWETAYDLGITPTANIQKTLGPMFEVAANIVLNLTPATTIIAEAAEITKNSSDFVDAVNKGEGVAGAAVKVTSSIVKTGVNHFVHVPGLESEAGQYIENGLKEVGLGVVGELEDPLAKFCNDQITKVDVNGKSKEEEVRKVVEKEPAKEAGRASTIFEEKDTSTPADIVIATDQNGEKMGISLGSDDGKVTAIVPGGTELSVTAIDKTGDKHTETITVPVGETLVIEGETKESTNIEVDESIPYIHIDVAAMEFEATGGSQSFIIDTNCAAVTAFVAEEDAENWCKVEVQDGGEVTVTVDENHTGKSRECTIVAAATNDAQDKDSYLLEEISLVQKSDERSVSVNPTTLEFDPNGGTKTVSYTVQGFPYQGVNGYAGWFSYVDSNGVLEITVEPNTSSETREGEITVWGSTVQMPGWNDPDKNNTDETIIKITQPGSGIGGSWEFVMDYEYKQSYTKYTKTYSWSFDNHGQYKYYEEIDSWGDSKHTMWDWGWTVRRESGSYTISGNTLNLSPTENTLYDDDDSDNKHPQAGSTTPYSLEFSVSSDGHRLTIAGKTYER